MMIGASDKESFSKLSISILNPFDNERIKAIPMIPIEEAKAVKAVLPFFVFIGVVLYPVKSVYMI